MSAQSREEQWGWVGRSELTPRRRQVMNSTEDLGGRGVKEELPVRGEGEAERDLSRADKSKLPRLTTQEQSVLLKCERPMDMEEWG